MPIDERLIFFEGKHVRLKALDECDVVESGWVGWFNDELLCRNNQHHYFPNSVARQLRFLESLAETQDKLQLGIIDKCNADKICGVVSLSNINYIHRHAEIGGFHAANETRGNSAIFLESWALLIRHAFCELGLHKIYGGTFHPHVAPALKRAFNFQEEGIRKQHIYKGGRFHDVSMLAVFSATVHYPDF